MAFALAADGGFTRAGRPFVPVGVNYWPASCGVEMWARWPEAEIRADLALVRRLGLNTVRFFLRWQDFEPRAGRLAAANLRRLDRLLGWCREAGLAAHPTLFVGFMSGGVFWPEWKRGRNLFADPVLRRRAARFAARVARVCRPHAASVLALDLGNELCCLPESLAAAPADVAAWCGAMARAVRGEWPDVLLVAGNEQNQVIHDTGWRLGEQPGMDLLSMHGYPVAAWQAVAFDGMRDPLGRSLLPFHTACARAFGPVLVQEFGTLLTAGAARTRGWLRAVLPACAAAGANGYLWWCLRDIATDAPPYAKAPFERGLGLVDAAGRVKPGLEAFLAFAARPSAPPPRGPTAGLYWPAEYYPRDNPRNPGNAPREASRSLALAHFALGGLGARVRVVRGGRPLPAPDALAALVVTGVRLTGPEWAALGDWVEAGGRLVVVGVDAFASGEALHRVLGARIIDFRAPVARPARGGAAWAAARFPREVRAEVALTTGRALVRSRDGDALVWRHALGRGAVVATTPEYDRAAADAALDPRARAAAATRWRRLWRWLHDSP